MASPQTQVPAINQQILSQIPDTPVCKSALHLAQKSLLLPILNHSLRVYLLTKFHAEKEGSDFASEPQLTLLFVAAIHHDIGTSDLYNGSQRFEVCSADCAKSHLLEHSYTEAQAHQAWTAIALHTLPGIAERIDPLSRLIRLAVLLDFGSPASRTERGVEAYYQEIEPLLPRLNAEKTLADAVVGQAKKIPYVDKVTYPKDEKFPPASWPGVLLRAHAENLDYGGVNPAF